MLNHPMAAGASGRLPQEQFRNAELAEPEDSTNLRPLLLQTWHAAVRRWRLIAAIVASVLVLGLVATLLMSPQYTARAQIEISRDQKNVTNVQGLEGAVDARDLEFYSTQYALLEAESLAERVSKRLKLSENESFFAAHGAKPIQMEDLIGQQNERALTQRRAEQAVALLLENVSISPIRNSRLVNVQYTSRDATLSARIANSWVREFIAATMDRQFGSTADARQFLEERLEQLRARLEQSERDAVNFASEKDIVAIDVSNATKGVRSPSVRWRLPIWMRLIKP
jgi:uncharacterized protein involved in exopolysaccharide biosynthesis